ncbi:MAG: PTS sugar transporter subunit IIA [Propionibacteriaceae bacterium]|jgi:PTS system galactitol-specific IIA component|nr:PTS sugar transporter subunit IIA [Propionibacteriaceae bacterium]
MMEIDTRYVAGLEAPDTDGVFEQLGSLLLRSGRVKPSFVAGLISRETRYPTGLPVSGGVAIPHTDPEHVLEDTLVVATLAQPVQFGIMAGEPGECVDVNVVFLLALSGSDGHVDALSELVQLVQDAEFIERLREAGSEAELASVIGERFG